MPPRCVTLARVILPPPFSFYYYVGAFRIAHMAFRTSEIAFYLRGLEFIARRSAVLTISLPHQFGPHWSLFFLKIHRHQTKMFCVMASTTLMGICVYELKVLVHAAKQWLQSLDMADYVLLDFRSTVPMQPHLGKRVVAISLDQC
jgi:hypothetical protein